MKTASSFAALIGSLAAAVALSLLSAAPLALAQDQLGNWRGRPSLEYSDPRIERSETMRVIRFSGDFKEIVDDQGTVIGWTKAAAEGKVKPREEPAVSGEGIEILPREEAEKALEKKEK